MANGVNNEVNTVAIKVTPFFKHAPETCFAHLEAQFDIKKLTTSSTKFYYCISALPSDVSAHLTHMIRDPGDDPYQEIKDRLIHLYNLSNYQKFEALINLPFTSDTPPSVFMSSMLNLYPMKFKPDFVFIGLFLRRLPQSIHDHLLALDLDEDPDRLAKKADQLFQSHQASYLNLISGEPIPPVFALRPPKPRPRRNSNSSSSYSTTSGRSSTPAASHRHQRSPSPVSSTCWFHRTHGDKAQKCKQPCSWSEN